MVIRLHRNHLGAHPAIINSSCHKVERHNRRAVSAQVSEWSLWKQSVTPPVDFECVIVEVEDNETIGGSVQHGAENDFRPVKQPVTPRTHVHYDAEGNKRMHPIKMLRGSRPNAQPHTRVSLTHFSDTHSIWSCSQFLDMEEPVMVRPNNASIGTAALNHRPLRDRRGCELCPDKVDFGILKEGKHLSHCGPLTSASLMNRCDLWNGNWNQKCWHWRLSFSYSSTTFGYWPTSDLSTRPRTLRHFFPSSSSMTLLLLLCS